MSALPPNMASKLQADVLASFKSLRETFDLHKREPQESLGIQIAQTAVERGMLIAEAPTGTGKSYAYLLGALAAYRAGGVFRQIVVSTASKALQQQLQNEDLPRLVEAGHLTDGQYHVLMGQQNYLCLNRAREINSAYQQWLEDPATYVTSDEAFLADAEEVAKMVDAVDAGRWNGMFPDYPDALPKSVIPIAVESGACLGQKCDDFKSCGYVAAKNKASVVPLLVVNHDWLLSDLKKNDDGSCIREDTLLVIDEAHAFGDKAVSAGTEEISMPRIAAVISAIPGLVRSVDRGMGYAVTGVVDQLKSPVEYLRAFESLTLFVESLKFSADAKEGETQRFSRGVPPPALLAALKEPLAELGELSDLLKRLGVALKSTEVAPSNKQLQEALRKVRARLYPMERQASSLWRAAAAVAAQMPDYAIWAQKVKGGTSIITAPLYPKVILRRYLYPATSSICMVSATLRSGLGFEETLESMGAPSNTRTMLLPYVLPYENSELLVADMKYTPKAAERKDYLEELKKKLPLSLNKEEGTLIVLTSWAVLGVLKPVLLARFGESNLSIQGDLPLKALIEQHKARLDAGRGNILVGVASLAEGIDLPGKYCTHLVLGALPFAVPVSPIEQELSERLGPDYFSRRSLPEAIRRLMQITGRLVRRESDVGRITVFDSRLATTSYGKKMQAALPPFKRAA